jgi:Fic family protein
VTFNSPESPYNELPFLPPNSGLNEHLLTPKLIEARVALAKLEQATSTSRFTIALAATIPLVEAQASSAIENIVTTQDDLFTSAVDNAVTGEESIAAVMRYHAAMDNARAYLETKPINPALCRLICSTLLGVEQEFRSTPGTRVGAGRGGQIVYTPPVGATLIEGLLDNWASFVNESKLDPLIKMALSHYQFEAIHPFRDGNGRTGRIINLLQLKADGLLTKPVLHLSRVIKDDLPNYYQRLQAATEQREYSAWVEYILEKVRAASEIALFQLEMLEEYSRELKVKGDRIFKGGIPSALLSVVTEYPYCTIKQVLEKCEVTRPTATKWLEALVAAGLLESQTRGRNKYFVNKRVLRILNP